MVGGRIACNFYLADRGDPIRPLALLKSLYCKNNASYDAGVVVAPELLELARLVEEQLARFGVAGRVECDNRALVLLGHGPRVVVAIDGELENYRSGTDAQRRHFVERVARDLASRRRLSQQPNSGTSKFLEWLRLLPGLLLVGGGVYGAWHWLGQPAKQAVERASQAQTPNAMPSVGSGEGDPQSAVGLTNGKLSNAGPRGEKSLLARCDEVRTRVSTGGTVTPLDVDGWVVEMTLLSSSGDLSSKIPALDGFLAKSPSGSGLAVSWHEEPALLAAAGSPETEVQVDKSPLAGVVPETHSGIRVTLFGQYVHQYFAEAGRLSLVRLSSALYDATGANYGAIYARCAEGQTHHMGAWFRGADWSKVSLALVAAMGLYADLPHLANVREEPLAQRRALSQFLDQAKRFDRSRLTMLLAEDGGMLASRPGQWAAFTFPFPDGNRATRTSLRLTRAVGLGPRR